jgi:hypothetical protein
MFWAWNSRMVWPPDPEICRPSFLVISYGISIKYLLLSIQRGPQAKFPGSVSGVYHGQACGLEPATADAGTIVIPTLALKF